MNRRSRAIGLGLITAMVLACAPTMGTAPAPAPTFDPNSINTIIAGTANAASTQTALFAPPTATSTFIPAFTAIPTETPTIVPTILIQLFTPTVASPIPISETREKFSCVVLSTSPRDGFGFSAGIEFTVSWTLQNTGTEEWDSASADIRFLSGDKIYVQSAYDLDQSVPPDSQYIATVKMKAPMEKGTYKTTWVIRTKVAEYCRMSITIVV